MLKKHSPKNEAIIFADSIALEDSLVKMINYTGFSKYNVVLNSIDTQFLSVSQFKNFYDNLTNKAYEVRYYSNQLSVWIGVLFYAAGWRSAREENLVMSDIGSPLIQDEINHVGALSNQRYDWIVKLLSDHQKFLYEQCIPIDTTLITA